jgi:GTPase
MNEKLHSLVIVGRPNVGKSSLFNRLTGTRRSIVADEPGITRDRIHAVAEWEGKHFEVVDTGGIIPEEKAGIPGEILRQARVAIANASFVLLVTDARTGPVPLDFELAQLLRRMGKPLIIVANKVDTPKQMALAAPFYELADKVFPISSEHGLGVDDLLDSVTADFPAEVAPEPIAEVNIAIVGRPNVGKSTLLNRMAGEERSIVSPEAGTTRDAVDTIIEREGKQYRFLDTAGIRRKAKTKPVAEKLSVVMARRHLERADVALLVIDGTLGVTSHDATIASYTQRSGSALIVVVNKWDLAVKAAQERADAQTKSKASPSRVNPMKLMADYEKLIRAKLKFLDYAPIVFLSALTGERTGALFPLIDRVIASRQRRISTGEMNRWLSSVDLDRGTSPAEHKIKIYYVTQASAAPPTFVLFTNQKRRLHFSYERVLENQLRKKFDFTGTPIRFQQRVKQRTRRAAGAA